MYYIEFLLIQYKEKSCNVLNQINITNPNYVFLGDSITEFYDLEKYYQKDLSIVNSGICGNITTDILGNMNNRVYKYNPSKVILLIGINNLLVKKDEPSKVYSDIEKIALSIKNKLPNCEIYIESIYPMNEDYSNYVSTEKIFETNSGIKRACDKHGFKYIDVYTYLLDKKTNQLNKKYSDEGLHINDEGYKIITEIVKKSIF